MTVEQLTQMTTQELIKLRMEIGWILLERLWWLVLIVLVFYIWFFILRRK